MRLLTIEEIRKQNYDLKANLVIKQYLPLAIKQLLIKNILESCTIEENGIKKINFSLKEFAYEFILISQYSNVDCEVDSTVQFYDELKENGVINQIVKLIPESEITFINNILNQEIEQKQKIDNSVEAIIANALTKLVDKLPDEKGISKLIKDLPKQINKISPDKLQYISQAIGWNNGFEKKE